MEALRDPSTVVTIISVIQFSLEEAIDQHTTYYSILLLPLDEPPTFSPERLQALAEDYEQLLTILGRSGASEILSIHLSLCNSAVEIVADGDVTRILGILQLRVCRRLKYVPAYAHTSRWAEVVLRPFQ